jgi:hypothetical protein
VGSGQIVEAMTDDEVVDAIGKELDRRLPANDDLDEYVRELQELPIGLRSMAATYQLDVSMALDDLGWHFGNWHHHGYASETASGLRVLGQERAAELFEKAYQHALQHWDRLGEQDWMDWYHESPLEVAVDPLNVEMWAILEPLRPLGIFKWWVDYARKHPGLLVEDGGRRTRR